MTDNMIRTIKRAVKTGASVKELAWEYGLEKKQVKAILKSKTPQSLTKSSSALQ